VVTGEVQLHCALKSRQQSYRDARRNFLNTTTISVYPPKLRSQIRRNLCHSSGHEPALGCFHQQDIQANTPFLMTYPQSVKDFSAKP
jgi:hypothetical protein